MKEERENKSFTGQLARFIEGLDYEMLPPDVIHMAKRVLLDFLGCAILGYHAPSSRILLKYLRDQGGKSEASIVIVGKKTTCLNAALAHGTMACSTELDDVQPRGDGCHAGEFVMPVVLALSERDHKSGKEAIVAIVAGYEATVRVGAAKTAEPFFKGVSPPVLSGPFGAASAASKLYGLDNKRIVDAFGITFPPLVPLGVFKAGVVAKDIKGGLASWCGLLAADLAKEGMEGLVDNLDGKPDRMGGVFNTIFGRYEEDHIAEGVGEVFEILRTGFKAYAACGLTHAPLTGMFEILKNQPIRPEDIEKITVKAFKFALEMGNPEPSSTNAALFSIPYTIACALINRSVMPEVFTDEEINDPRKRELARKIEIIWDPIYDAGWPESHRCSIEVMTRGGKILQKEVGIKKGHPDFPLTDEELVEKFERLSVRSLGKDRVKKIVDRVFSLEELGDMTELIHLLHK